MSSANIETQNDDIEIGDQYDEADSVRLVEGIDISKLCSGEGTEFEIRTDDIPDFKTKTYFDGEDMIEHLSHDAMGIPDNDGADEEESGEMPFDRLSKTMVDISPDKDGAILKKIITEGTGSKIPHNAFVTVHYDAYYELGDQPFDSSWLRGSTTKFVLGKGSVILGLDIGVSTMRKDEFSKFLVKPDYAYGELGCHPRIPPNATVLLNVKLISFSEHACIDYFDSLTRQEKQQMPVRELIAVAQAKNELGRQFFEEQRFAQAKKKYNQASKILEEAHLQNDEDERQQQKMLLKVYNNLAMCALKLNDNPFVITCCNRAMEIDGGNTKALYRKGLALHKLGDFSRAKSCFKKAQKKLPTDALINTALENLEKSIRDFKLIEKEQCQRMFQTNKKEEDKTTPLRRERSNDQSSTVSQAFKQMVNKKLTEFRADNSLTELPFPAATFRDVELSHILITAEDMGFKTSHIEKDSTFIVKITKD